MKKRERGANVRDKYRGYIERNRGAQPREREREKMTEIKKGIRQGNV